MSTDVRTARWIATDAWTVARRDLQHWAREPWPVIFGLLFPVMITLVFGYLFGGAMEVPGGDYFEFLMPGMFGMTMLFGISATMIAVTTDASRGVTDRFRSMPMSSAAVLLGRSIADMLNSVAMLGIMLATGLAVGWRAHGSAADTLLAVGLLLWLRFALLWIGIYLGLLVKSPGAVTAVQTLEFPLGFLSSAFVAPGTMPGWLGAIAAWNPLSSTVGAARDLFGNPAWGNGESWVAEHPVLMGTTWPLVILAVFVPLSIRAFRRLSR